MPRYRVGLVQTVVEEATVEIDADTPEEACMKAEREASLGLLEVEVEWTFVSTTNSIEVVSVDEIKEVKSE